MIPVVTPEEMAGVDRSAPEPVEVLIGRAGAAVARAALAMLAEHTDGIYGRKVVVVAGKGNNGGDGRAAAARLERRGVSVTLVEAAALGAGARLPDADLVIDAAYGTGLTKPYAAPDPNGAPVLAVDIPSGISGLTGDPVGGGEGGGGEPAGSPARAERTVTFAALKPGLVLGAGPEHTGTVEVAGIGLGELAAEAARMWLVTDNDVATGIPARPRNAHKWQSALQVVAGSPGMSGAPWMVSRAAMRAGAGYVRLGMPGMSPTEAGLPPGELVSRALPGEDWAEEALDGIERVKALVVGPGLGAAGRGSGGAPGDATPVARLLAGAPDTPAVVDADGLNALGDLDAVAAVVARRRAPTILTPHDGEFARLTGDAPGPDRVASARAAARSCGAIVLLKGSVTIVASPEGVVLLSSSGSARLATAGTGDVLSGVIGGLLARGVPAALAGALGAHVHGRAAATGWHDGLVATDLPDLVAAWMSAVLG
ncbi:NAD(P)H-hydrate dehydratase [Acidiferrimicrobium sp. IK]|uniref:NAD(P)H-hydrate dehydratase n=1 Tax=Acidiferrimicrobium sp. IK TaxID=2871700 RepID=UPI0021CB5525|nr:NAD(P)H-hydrate dehydratase [Acidiferrimicrobium sp. IK]MCU4184984.1 NAD(P)H-hydrate dehydratase [Acidiferrimicrobium sp. IK]